MDLHAIFFNNEILISFSFKYEQKNEYNSKESFWNDQNTKLCRFLFFVCSKVGELWDYVKVGNVSW